MKYKNGQKNLTITDEQKKFVEANFGKMNIGQLSKMLGITYNKTHNNLKVMGLYTPREEKGIVVDMETYFDIDKFAKFYEY